MVEGSGERPAPETVRPRRATPPDAATVGAVPAALPIAPRASTCRPRARFPRPPTASASTAESAPPVGDTTGSLQLPHWTEPPTGEVPQFGGDVDAGSDDDDDDDLWSGVSEPRFRSDVGDYAGSGFGDDPLHDDTTALGALVDMPDIDDDEEFAAEVAARRAPGRRRSSRAARSEPREAIAVESATMTAGACGRRVRRRCRSGSASRASQPAAGHDVRRHHHAHHHRLDPRGGRLLAFAIGRAATAVLVTVIVAAAAMELFDGLRRAGFQPATLIGLLGSLAMVGIAYNYGERAFPLVGVIVLGFTLFWYLAKVVHARPMVNAAVTLLGYAYIGVLGGFAGLLLAYPDGLGMLIGLVLSAVAYDIVGYLVGSRMGRRALAPEVSPNKTVEGLVAGMAASVFMGAVISQLFGLHPWNDFSNGLLLGVVVAIFAPLGDLCESMLKRDLGLKDFGALLPGHGGVLDRFDAMLFCLPAVYYLVVARGII